MLIGKANFYKRDFDKALESFEYVSKHYKKHPIKYYALVWMIKTYTATENFMLAQSILDMIKDEKNIKDLKRQPRKLKASLASTEAYFYLMQESYGPAIKPLKEALSHTKKKKTKVRYAYILAQLYQKQRDFKKASEQFLKVLELNPSYEMAFNAQINRAQGMSNNDTKTIKRDLEKMLNDEKNSDYFDQVYYALAELSQLEGDKESVISYLNKSIRASKSNNHQKGLAYETLGNIYFDIPDYPIAEAYYDSAANNLNRDYSKYH
ncbi:MAG TPA: tetratricopeptide repeat protein [Flavobacteriales bacterium]|nr:tetratricopeptide repeat protein [Flavobacteriales bacterium]